MPSITRRSFLATLGTAGVAGVAGCNAFGSEDVPAGALQVVNRDTLPHEIAMEVADVGAEYDEETREVVGDPIVPQPLRERQMTVVLDAQTTRTYEDIFTEPVWYTVRFTIDGEAVPNSDGTVSFYPGPREDSTVAGEYLRAGVHENGEQMLHLSGTDNSGPFDQ